ncbi:junctional sarcoplasmic reticulum protein 1 [Dunckerocampus dactyliophorus]|uniref:junctional sarcoplasmic reticulum protein 1 n=1 Tax=Dunckerocampus dactyliophorus TaxID=161453 RepID=UPI002404D76C|nr:junctional sarcoplasmic reticulum protein 1 [Dunckerocampus dactyliophorus]
MEESYETFEEELGPPREDPPPQKPVRQLRRPEMYTNRKVREEMSAVPQQPKVEPKTSAPRKLPLYKSMSIQNLSQIETPWENVTLNRCLFVAITILVLTSGMQRLHEALRGQEGTAEKEEVELTVRQPSMLRHRGKPLQPETTLWEVLFWWLPDLDDDDDKDDDGKRQARRGGLRNKPVPDKKLLKQRDGTLKSRRAKKVKDQKAKVKKEKDAFQKPEEENEDVVPNTKTQEKEKKKKTQKG